MYLLVVSVSQTQLNEQGKKAVGCEYPRVLQRVHLLEHQEQQPSRLLVLKVLPAANNKAASARYPNIKRSEGVYSCEYEWVRKT